MLAIWQSQVLQAPASWERSRAPARGCIILAVMGRRSLGFILFLLAGCIVHRDYPTQVALTPSTSNSPAQPPTHRFFTDPPSGSLGHTYGPFAPFFDRVKHQVREHWHPDVAFRQHGPTFSIHGGTTRLTIVAGTTHARR